VNSREENAGSVPALPKTMTTFPENSTAVLVHGAWADGSCWANVIGPLKQEGLNVICAPIPLTSLTDDIAALGRALERTSGPVVLAGHAYGGAVIQAASDEQVKSLVYIAALAPEEGETVANVFYRDEPHADAPKLAPNKHGCFWLTEEGFRKAVAHKAPQNLIEVMAAVQRPISIHCIQQPAMTPAWKTKPTWYLLAEEDRMINPKTQRFMAERMRATIRSVRADHSPMYMEPKLVVGIILEAARATLGR
jgi:pimeloyl-ACP methyl ester carboxylesterase